MIYDIVWIDFVELRCITGSCCLLMLCSHCLGFVFYGQLLEQLSVASLSRPIVVLYCYSVGVIHVLSAKNDHHNHQHHRHRHQQKTFEARRYPRFNGDHVPCII